MLLFHVSSPIVCVEPRISSISSANVSKTVIFTRIQTSSSPSSSCLLARGIECSVSCSMLWGRILLCVQWIWEGSNFEKQNEMNICVFQSKTLPKQLKLYWVSLESTELNTIELWIFTTSWSHVHWTIPGSKQPSLLNRWTVPAPWGGFPQLKRFGSPNVPPRMLDIHMSTHNDVSMHFICESGTSGCTYPGCWNVLLPQDLRCNLFVFLRLFCPIVHWTRAFLRRVGPPSNHRPPAPMAVKWQDSYVRWVPSNHGR